MHLKFKRIALLFGVLLSLAPFGFAQQIDSAKGDAMLKAMSQKLASAQTFSFETTESHDGLSPSGRKIHVDATRQTLVRRPNGFWTKFSGDRDWEFWYDGKMLTGISNEKKIYVQRAMPSTLDATIDMLATRLNLDLPMSDILYSSPYDAFIDEQTQGGFAGMGKIGDSSCGHLVYTNPAANWELWIDEKTQLPCKLQITYKKDTGHSFYSLTFSNWNFSPQVKDDAFAAKVPQDYVRIAMLERVLLRKGKSAQTQTAPANP